MRDYLELKINKERSLENHLNLDVIRYFGEAACERLTGRVEIKENLKERRIPRCQSGLEKKKTSLLMSGWGVRSVKEVKAERALGEVKDLPDTYPKYREH